MIDNIKKITYSLQQEDNMIHRVILIVIGAVLLFMALVSFAFWIFIDSQYNILYATVTCSFLLGGAQCFHKAEGHG